MHPPTPIETRPLFRPDREALLALLVDLSPAQWRSPTTCSGWSVKDVAAHIWGGDLGNVSRRRDRYLAEHPRRDESLGTFIGRFNQVWVDASRRLSPAVILAALETSGEPLFAHFDTLDPDAIGPPVSWAGDDPAPAWLDVGREYTERWLHQQHIRDAVGVPGQTEPRFLAPVLETFAHAFPVALRPADAPDGTAVEARVEGPGGGVWTLRREGRRWQLLDGGVGDAAIAARLTIDAEVCWRLLTLGLSPDAAEARVRIEGDQALARQLLHAVAIIA